MRPRAGSLLLTLATLVQPYGPALGADPVILRTALEPDSGIRVGQQVGFRLDVLGLDGWGAIERLPDLQVPGAQVMRVESQGTRLTETIGGESYGGQRYQWLLFPQRAGAVSIPGLPVEVGVKTFGSGDDTQTHELQTPPLSFEAALPPGADEVVGLISTSELKVSQSWEPQVTELAPGDGIKRTIRLQAADVSGMAFAPLSHAPIEGLTIYAGEPEIADEVDRGSLERGKRVETVTYVPERAGEFSLPELSFHWWDTEAQVRKESTLEGLSLRVAAGAPGRKSGAVPAAVGAGAAVPRWLGIALVAAALAGGLAWLWKDRLSSLWCAYRAHRREREPAYFERFVTAAGSGNPEHTLDALMRWLDRLELPQSPARLDGFVAKYGDDAANRESGRLVSAFAGDAEEGWDGAGLIRAMTSARRRYLDLARSPSRVAGAGLPPLNPPRPGILFG